MMLINDSIRIDIFNAIDIKKLNDQLVNIELDYPNAIVSIEKNALIINRYREATEEELESAKKGLFDD